MKAVFFDRDGTINVDTGYISDPAGITLYPLIIEALNHVKSRGYLVFVVSNQSGIGRGIIMPWQYREVNKMILALIGEELVDEVLYCPHRPDDGCACRKPGTLLLEIVKENYDIDFDKSYFIGDRETDILCGKTLGMKTIKIGGRPDEFHSSSDTKNKNSEPDYIVNNIMDVVNIIRES